MEKNTEIIRRMEGGKTHPIVCTSMELPPSTVDNADKTQQYV